MSTRPRHVATRLAVIDRVNNTPKPTPRPVPVVSIAALSDFDTSRLLRAYEAAGCPSDLAAWLAANAERLIGKRVVLEEAI